jgi:hypothetical protein
MPDEATHEYTYTGLVLEQQPGAPTMYLLTVDAPDLLEWADVPNAQADYMAGYQRVFDPDRARQISEFLAADPKNIVPGAVIVTASADAVSIATTDDPAVVRVSIEVEDLPFEERLANVYAHFSERLSEAERESIEEAEVDPASLEVDEDESESGGIPDSYIAALTAELRAAVEDISSLPAGREDAIRNYIDSVSKPGLIIDGQHRVFGAKDVSQNDVRLPVILLPGLEMGEQVFHFYVLNNKAKPLSPTELRRTISTSLSNAEIEGLWKRFEDAGVNPEATRWTHKMSTDPSSPFKDLIDFGLGGSGFIRENVAYQLVSKFVNMPRKYRILYLDVPAWQQGSDDRLTYFYVFWSAIKERYASTWAECVAERGGQLFYKAALLVLQEFILDFLVQVMNVRRVEGKPSPFADYDELRQYVMASLADLPDEFFTMEWQEKQLDTSERRAFLRGQMEVAVRNQGKFLGNQQLFKKS